LQEESFERVKKALTLALDRRDANPRSYT